MNVMEIINQISNHFLFFFEHSENSIKKELITMESLSKTRQISDKLQKSQDSRQNPDILDFTF